MFLHSSRRKWLKVLMASTSACQSWRPTPLAARSLDEGKHFIPVLTHISTELPYSNHTYSKESSRHVWERSEFAASGTLTPGTSIQKSHQSLELTSVWIHIHPHAKITYSEQRCRSAAPIQKRHYHELWASCSRGVSRTHEVRRTRRRQHRSS